MGLGYKDWRSKHKLHSSKGWSGLTDWTKLRDKSWNETHDFKWQWIVVGTFVVLALLVGEAKAGQFYDFPYEDTITMDVVKTNGGGGTWKCASVRDCYIRTLEAEARGANQYCETITIKRNGKPVWFRKYR